MSEPKIGVICDIASKYISDYLDEVAKSKPERQLLREIIKAVYDLIMLEKSGCPSNKTSPVLEEIKEKLQI